MARKELAKFVAAAFLEKYFREDDNVQALMKVDFFGNVIPEVQTHVLTEFGIEDTEANRFLLNNLHAICPSIDMHGVLPQYGYDTRKPGSLRIGNVLKFHLPALNLKGEQIVVKIGEKRQIFLLASATCRYIENEMYKWALWQKFNEKDEFFFVYGKEAHPFDKSRLDTSDAKQIHKINAHKTIEDRLEAANIYASLMNIDVIVDDMDDLWFNFFSAFPARLIVIDHGVISLIVPITSKDPQLFQSVDNLLKGEPFFNPLVQLPLKNPAFVKKKIAFDGETRDAGENMAKENFQKSLENFLRH